MKGSPSTAPAERNLYDDLHFLQSLQNLDGVRAASKRPVFGPMIVLARRTLKTMMAPILTRQSEYNRTNVRLLRGLVDSMNSWLNTAPRIGLSPREEALASDALILDAVRVRHGELIEMLARSNAEIENLKAETSRLSQELRRLQEELARTHRPEI